jgi:NADPH2:quinone reductase
MPYAARIDEVGGPENLKWEEVEIGDPAPGQVRVRHTATGLEDRLFNTPSR